MEPQLFINGRSLLSSIVKRLNFCNFDPYYSPAVSRTQINNSRTITQHGAQELEEWMQEILISLSVQREAGTPETDPVWPALSGATQLVR